MEILDEVVSEEKDVEKIFDESPVHVSESSLPDVLALNDLKKQIEAKDAEKVQQENEIDKHEKQRAELVDKIGIINNGQHINAVITDLTNLRKLDEQLFSERANLEEIYGALNDLNKDYNSLDESTREMVNKMTVEYNSLNERQQEAVNDYMLSANFSYYQLALDITDELNTYRTFENFEAILEGKELDKEEAKEEEEKAEVTPIVEDKPEEKSEEVQQEAELSEVKVDALPEEEKKEEQAEVTPIVEEPKAEEVPVEEGKIEMPSFEELMAKAKEAEEKPVQEEQAEVTPLVNDAPVEETAPALETPVETPAAEVTPVVEENKEVQPEADLKIAMLTSLHDRIAETDRAKVTGIKEVFAKANSIAPVQTLVKTAKVTNAA